MMVAQMNKIKTSNLVNRILRTAQLIDGFWERWIVHGIEEEDIQSSRKELLTYDRWVSLWDHFAESKLIKAKMDEENLLHEKAERLYRQTALYYNLIYWLDPESSEVKKEWYLKSLEMMKKADALSKIETFYKAVFLEGFLCKGRIRIPFDPIGCIIIINPIDSSKEELYKYEEDFLHRGFATISFDGPGQGETFILDGVIGTRNLWEKFINQMIDYVTETFPDLPIHLFGTSLGGSWVIFGSAHPKVSSAVSVSPAVALENMHMPTYFMKRMECSCLVDKSVHPIPNFENLKVRCPVLVFHGSKDMMVPNKEMNALYNRLPSSAKMITYQDAGHCCNFHLDEIRKLAAEWFIGSKVTGGSECV